MNEDSCNQQQLTCSSDIRPIPKRVRYTRIIKRYEKLAQKESAPARPARQLCPAHAPPKKQAPGHPSHFLKGPNLNNNAVTRESIRNMRSANFVSKFLRPRSPVFAATIVVAACSCPRLFPRPHPPSSWSRFAFDTIRSVNWCSPRLHST